MSLINHDQREHLKLIRENGPEVAIDVCKLTLDYLNNGPNTNRYQTIANKLKITTDSLQDTINALVMLQISSIKANVSEQDFLAATQNGFNSEQVSILWQFVTSKRDFMANILKQFSIHEYRFRDLEWRLEARIASRSLLNQSIPFITIKIYLDTETINENKERLAGGAENADKTLDENEKSRLAKVERQRKQVLFQTDPNNLIYLIDVLEKALEEAKTHRIRNIVKAF